MFIYLFSCLFFYIYHVYFAMYPPVSVHMRLSHIYRATQRITYVILRQISKAALSGVEQWSNKLGDSFYHCTSRGGLPHRLGRPTEPLMNTMF